MVLRMFVCLVGAAAQHARARDPRGGDCAPRHPSSGQGRHRQVQKGLHVSCEAHSNNPSNCSIS